MSSELLIAAGYDLSAHDTRVLPGAGPDGQPIFVHRMPVSFRESGNRGRSVLFSVFAHWMGKMREIGIGPAQRPMQRDLATGKFAIVTNGSSIQMYDEIGWPDVIDSYLWIGPWYGRENATLDLFFDWILDSNAGLKRIASSKMSVTWAQVSGHGQVEPVPPPPYYKDLMDSMAPPPSPIDRSPVVISDVDGFGLAGVEDKILFERKPSPRNKNIVSEFRFETSLEDSNVVGNVYFSNYYIWQSRARDLYINRVLPGVFQVFGNSSSLEPIVLESSVSHLRECMPFDRILTTMAVRKISEYEACLYFEYFREEASGERSKLAFGEQRMGWIERDSNGGPVRARMPSAFVDELTRVSVG